jgi:hypothetical protein
MADFLNMKLVGLHGLVSRAEMAYRLLILKIFSDSVTNGRDTDKVMELLYGGAKSSHLHTFFYNLLARTASPSTAEVRQNTTTTDQTSPKGQAASSSTVPPSTTSSNEEGTSNQLSKKKEKEVKKYTHSEKQLNK